VRTTPPRSPASKKQSTTGSVAEHLTLLHITELVDTSHHHAARETSRHSLKSAEVGKRPSTRTLESLFVADSAAWFPRASDTRASTLRLRWLFPQPASRSSELDDLIGFSALARDRAGLLRLPRWLRGRPRPPVTAKIIHDHDVAARSSGTRT
jgi:hypothetical protein